MSSVTLNLKKGTILEKMYDPLAFWQLEEDLTVEVETDDIKPNHGMGGNLTPVPIPESDFLDERRVSATYYYTTNHRSSGHTFRKTLYTFPVSYGQKLYESQARLTDAQRRAEIAVTRLELRAEMARCGETRVVCTNKFDYGSDPTPAPKPPGARMLMRGCSYE